MSIEDIDVIMIAIRIEDLEDVIMTVAGIVEIILIRI